MRLELTTVASTTCADKTALLSGRIVVAVAVAVEVVVTVIATATTTVVIALVLLVVITTVETIVIANTEMIGKRCLIICRSIFANHCLEQ